MHTSKSEISVPTLIECGYKTYTILGAAFEVPQHYTVLRCLGRGAYGIVCSALDTRTGEKVAIKKFRDVFRNVNDGLRVLRELDLMRHFALHPHDNVLPILSVLPPKGGRTAFRDVYAVMPLKDVDLSTVLRSKQKLDEPQIQYIMYQTLRGLAYLHAGSIAHRDLKPANIGLDVNLDLSIFDFGLSRQLENIDRDENELTDYVVTRYYRAPELLIGSHEYDGAVDVWAAGLIFAELFTRKPLLPGQSTLDQIKKTVALLGKQGFLQLEGISKAAKRFVATLPDDAVPPLAEAVPTMTNPDALDLLKKMLTVNPTERPTALQLLSHPFLATYADDSTADTDALLEEPFDWPHERFPPAPAADSQLPTAGAVKREEAAASADTAVKKTTTATGSSVSTRQRRPTKDDLREYFWTRMRDYHPELADIECCGRHGVGSRPCHVPLQPATCSGCAMHCLPFPHGGAGGGHDEHEEPEGSAPVELAEMDCDSDDD